MASLQNNLYLLCGIPGSGKSTLAWALSSNNVILLSSDSLRAIIGKDESDQAVSAQVFGTMEAMTEYFLRQGKDVAIDATNYNRKSRAKFIQIGRKYNAEIVALVATTPLEECKRRNAARARVVPDDVLDRMHAGFEIPTVGEVDKVDIF